MRLVKSRQVQRLLAFGVADVGVGARGGRGGHVVAVGGGCRGYGST